MSYRAAVIGCGGRGRRHAIAYDMIENAELVACCDMVEERREALAAEFRIAPYADMRKMIRAEKPDIVHVATRPETRVEPLRLVSELGVPLCTVEKPIATAVADWRILCGLEKDSDTKFAVCHQTRWNPWLERCREVIRGGKLGRPLLLHMSAVMNIAGQGTHALNYGLSLAGDPRVTQVFANSQGWDTHDKVHPGPEATEAYLVCEGDIPALWTSGRVSPRCGDPATTHEHVRTGGYFENGRVEWQQFGKWEISCPAGTEKGACFIDKEQFQKVRDGEQAAFHEAMFRWLEDDGRPVGTNLSRSLHEWAVILAMYQSTLERRPVDMANFHPQDNLVDRYRLLQVHAPAPAL